VGSFKQAWILQGKVLGNGLGLAALGFGFPHRLDSLFYRLAATPVLLLFQLSPSRTTQLPVKASGLRRFGFYLRGEGHQACLWRRSNVPILRGLIWLH
jgi:hypothetical protein